MNLRSRFAALGFAAVCLTGLEALAQSSTPPAPSKRLPEVSSAAPTGDPAVVQTAQEVAAAEASATPLEDLAWMVGDWVDQDDQGQVEASVAWTKNGKFLRRMFRVVPKEGDSHTGMQIIGWDPAERTVRSWTYDENGGFGEETWNRVGDRWAIRAKYTLPDGGHGAAMHVMRRLSDDAFTWKSVNRLIDGAPQPDVDEVTVVRKPAPVEGEAPAPAPAPEATPAPSEKTQPETNPAPAPTSETPR